MPRREVNCDIPLRWQVFGGAISIVIFMHLTQLATEALLGERVPQRTEDIEQDNHHVSQILSNNNNNKNNHDDELERLPSMHLLMEPLFNNSGTPRPEPIAINVNMTLSAESGRFAPGRPLLTLPLMIGKVPSARYDDETNPLSAYDSRGQPVQLSYRDEDPAVGPRVWYVHDENLGGADSTDVQLLVSFTAPYRKTDNATATGARVDLRRDVSGGGLMGQGISFLPTPPPPSSHDGSGDSIIAKKADDQGGRRENWNVTLEWDLGSSPAGTHGAWSFGDADHVNTIGPLYGLINRAVFAVGYLQRYPDWDADLSSSSDVQAATYWFDPSPYNITALATQSLASYTRIAEYFNASDLLRVFIRRIETNWGGSGATKSFLLEYSDETPEYADALSLAELLAHETVHEFALLDEDRSAEGRDPSWQEDEGAWYVEGVASYVGDLVGLDDRTQKEDLLQVLNNNLQAYYTAPRWVLEMDYGDVLANYWRSTVDVTRVSYSRGFVFLAQLDGLIGQATAGEKSLDDVILGLYELRVEGKPCTIRELAGIVSDLIGREAFDAVYAAFFRGDLIVPDEDCLLGRYGLKLVRMDWHRFELGFETNSLRAFNVSGLVEGSNAEKAGVREGDKIIKTFMLWTVEDSLDGKMKMTVLREGDEVDLEWLPRSDEVVEAYGWVEIDGGDPEEL